MNPGEMLVCPYDKCHRVSGDIITKHLQKCRKNYELTQDANCEGTWAMRCKYNHQHIVYPPELLFHEARCEGRNRRIPLHELNQVVDHVMKTGDAAQVKAVEGVFEEQVQMWREGLFLKTKITSKNAAPQTILSSVDNTHYPHLYKMMKAEEAMKKAEAKTQEGVTDPNSIGAASLPPQQKVGKQGVVAGVASGNQEAVEGSDDEDWGKSAKSPGAFYYKENLLHPVKPLMNTYPPGLSKAERREYDKFNTRWIKSIREKEEEQEMDSDMQNLIAELGIENFADTPSASGVGTDNTVKPEGDQDKEKK